METATTLAKVAFTLAGPIILTGGSLAYANTDILSELHLCNDAAYSKLLGATAFISMTYVMIFTRGFNLWGAFSKPARHKQQDPLPPPITPDRLSYTIAILITCSSLCYFFFSSYPATTSTLKLINISSRIAIFTLWIYVWFSLTMTYVNFSLQRAINNGHDIAQFFSAPNRHAVNIPALKKAILYTAMGTIAFGAFAHSLVKNSANYIPIIKNFPDEVKTSIAIIIAAASSTVFILTKSLETYQYISRRRHFSAPENSTLAYSRKLYRSHKVIGITCLAMIFIAYCRATLDKLNLVFGDTNLYCLLPALIFSASATFIEYVFSYKNMFAETQRFFSLRSASRVGSEDAYQEILPTDKRELLI